VITEFEAVISPSGMWGRCGRTNLARISSAVGTSLRLWSAPIKRLVVIAALPSVQISLDAIFSDRAMAERLKIITS
jgi:hypothetical protein